MLCRFVLWFAWSLHACNPEKQFNMP